MNQLNRTGLDLVKRFEGCKLQAYQDIVGIWTIGFGETLGVQRGMKWTQEEAEKRLAMRLVDFSNQVRRLLKVELTDNQFSAVVCLVYNIGVGAFKSSTLLKKLNASDLEGAAKEFIKWNKAGGAVVKGLTRRREAEAALFNLL